MFKFDNMQSGKDLTSQASVETYKKIASLGKLFSNSRMRKLIGSGLIVSFLASLFMASHLCCPNKALSIQCFSQVQHRKCCPLADTDLEECARRCGMKQKTDVVTLLSGEGISQNSLMGSMDTHGTQIGFPLPFESNSIRSFFIIAPHEPFSSFQVLRL